MSTLADRYAALADLSAPFSPPDVAGLGDADLMDAARVVAEIQRRAGACAAVIAGEVAHRSRREPGYDGLAAKQGARSPVKLVQSLHNNGWQIIRRGAEYFFVPPPDIDPAQTPIPARRNPLLARLTA